MKGKRCLGGWGGWWAGREAITGERNGGSAGQRSGGGPTAESLRTHTVTDVSHTNVFRMSTPYTHVMHIYMYSLSMYKYVCALN